MEPKDLKVILDAILVSLEKGKNAAASSYAEAGGIGGITDGISENISKFTSGLKSNSESKKLDDEIDDEYLKIGIVAYELYKMGVDLPISNFKENFLKIESLESLKNESFTKNASSKIENAREDIVNDEIFDRSDSDEAREPVKIETTGCPHCGASNTIYAKNCVQCGAEL